MDLTLARRRVEEAAVARLVSVTAEGTPHAVPCCFALVGDVAYSAVDSKPKSTTMLKRISNIESNPTVALLVDHYEDDWDLLWWVRLDATAHVADSGPLRQTALNALCAKYPQYRRSPPVGPAVVMHIRDWRTWP